MAIHYDKIFGHNYRIIIAVLFGVTFSSLFNGIILSKLRKLFNSRYFVPRSFISSFAGESFEAIFVGLIGYIFIIPTKDIFIMAGSVMIYRTLMNLPLSIIGSLVISIVRKIDKIPYNHVSLN